MKNVSMLMLTLVISMTASAQAQSQAQSRDQTQTTQRIQTQDCDRIYGSELMTWQERVEYQSRMRAAKTEQEREQIRLEHHHKMQERAKAQGKTLPDKPPADRGHGMGPGTGSDMGPGSGSGMGGGYRR